MKDYTSMTTYKEERETYQRLHGMSEDFVDWFFDEKAPEIPKHMHLVTAACMWEGWKALASREAQPVAYRYRYSGDYLANFGCTDMVSSWKYCEEVSLVNPDDRYERQALFTGPSAPAVQGVVVVTRDEKGAIVAVTRQNNEGQILEVIAEA